MDSVKHFRSKVYQMADVKWNRCLSVSSRRGQSICVGKTSYWSRQSSAILLVPQMPRSCKSESHCLSAIMFLFTFVLFFYDCP